MCPHNAQVDKVYDLLLGSLNPEGGAKDVRTDRTSKAEVVP
jgi:hypothetical protein